MGHIPGGWRAGEERLPHQEDPPPPPVRYAKIEGGASGATRRKCSNWSMLGRTE